HLQRERHVVVDRHVRVKRVGLEHHRDVAVLGGNVVHHALADHDAAFADGLDAGEHAKRGRLTAARRTDEHHELLVLDLDVEVIDDGEVGGVPLDDVVISYRCHLLPIPSTESTWTRLPHPCPSVNILFTSS